MLSLNSCDRTDSAESTNRSVTQVWRVVEAFSELWQRGAVDAYGARKMQMSDASYIAGYLAQMAELPTDASGNIEWFRYRPDGGWKLTDNI